MLLLKDECALCKRLFRSSGLRRCFRCGKYYCFDCRTYNEEGYIICLNCARKLVSPERLGTKYSELSRYLLRRGQYADHFTMKFAEIEAIIGNNLPLGSARDGEWWANSRASAQGRAWTDVGWQVVNIDLQQRTVTFVRVAQPKQTEIEGERETKPTRKRRQKKVPTPFESKTYKFTQPRKFKPPSKTRIAKAQARLRNVERERAAGMNFRGKLKPRQAYEKRLFKPEAKPSEK